MIYKIGTAWEVLFEFDHEMIKKIFIAAHLEEMLTYVTKVYEGLKIESIVSLGDDVEVVSVIVKYKK